MTVSKVYTLINNKSHATPVESFVGKPGDIFYNPESPELRISDGVTRGGSVLLSSTLAAEDYRGFYAGLNSVYGDDPSIQQIIISQSSSAGYLNQTNDTDNDDFQATSLEGSGTIVALNVYGNNSSTALTTTAISKFVKAFIDTVMFDGESLRNNVDDIKTAFYDNIQTLTATQFSSGALYENFEFFNGDSWPTNSIDDGGGDQYDGGNYLNTNLATQLSYNNGDPVYEDASLNGGDYVVLYGNSIFAFVAINADINSFYYTGGLGADSYGSKMVKALFGVNNLATNLGNFRIATWGYPGNTPVRLTNVHPGESIMVQSTDNPDTGVNGRTSLRWHMRWEPNAETGPTGSKYSQVDVQNDGAWIKNADWSGSEGVWYWHFDDHGVMRLPGLTTDGGGSIIDGSGNVVVALDTNGNKIVGDSSFQAISVAANASHNIPNFSGMLMVNDHYDGGVELWICGGTNAVLVSATRPSNVGTMAMDGTGYSWTNPSAANLQGPFTFTVIKTRNGA